MAKLITTMIDPRLYMKRVHDKFIELQDAELFKGNSLDRSRFNALVEADKILTNTMTGMLEELRAEILSHRGIDNAIDL